jgi:hypothetical protein
MRHVERVKSVRKRVNAIELSRAIERTREYLAGNDVYTETVTPNDIIAYFDGEAPSGDTTALEDVVRQRWLMIHETVEVSELKRRQLQVSASTLRDHPYEVHQCHLIATRTEFRLARQENDSKWLRMRVPLIRTWLNDEGLTDEMRAIYLGLEREFEEYL